MVGTRTAAAAHTPFTQPRRRRRRCCHCHRAVCTHANTPHTAQTPHASFTGDASPRSPLDAYRVSAAGSAPGGAGSYAWWRHLDSAALNIKPDEKACDERGYTPQFEVAGQGMRYRQHANDEGASHCRVGVCCVCVRVARARVPASP